MYCIRTSSTLTLFSYRAVVGLVQSTCGPLGMVALMMTVIVMAMQPVCGPYQSIPLPMMDRQRDMTNPAPQLWLLPSAMVKVDTKMLVWWVFNHLIQTAL